MASSVAGSVHTSHTQTSLDAVPEKNPGLGVHAHSAPETRAASPAPSHHRPLPHMMVSNIHTKEYFVGPRELEKHSKLPYFMRMSGSVTPRLIVPILFVSAWSTLITCISEFIHPLYVNDVLLTVLGFVIGLAISFRTSSAYERYVDGRKYWTQLTQNSRDLARYIWLHIDERHDEDEKLGKADLLAKITALNLIVTFAVALKHKLRFEPYTNHEDLEHLVEHLQTFAGDAWDPDNATPHKISTIKLVGEYLDVSFAESNPRKMVKRSKKNLGNLPLEILLYLSAYVESTRKNKTFSEGPIQAMAMGCIANMNEVLSGAERVVNTPLPIAYSISISQITWIYIVVLPFQLLPLIGWLAIPGTIISAFIILSLAAIGREIENPFGDDTNDLPLDSFCRDIAKEMDIIMSRPPPKPETFIAVPTNKPLFQLNYDAWASRSVQEIRDSLRVKATTASIQNHPMDKNQHLKSRTTSSSV